MLPALITHKSLPLLQPNQDPDNLQFSLTEQDRGREVGKRRGNTQGQPRLFVSSVNRIHLPMVGDNAIKIKKKQFSKRPSDLVGLL